MKEETKHGSVRSNNFGSKRSAIKLDKIFMGEEEVREKEGLAFTRAREGVEVRKEMEIGRTGKSLTYIEEGGVDGERTRATAEFEIDKGKR